jgi:hypothetical protein
MSVEKIVVVALLTQREVNMLGGLLDRVWPVDETPCFPGLLQAIDEADRKLWRDRDAEGRALELPQTSTAE